MLGRGAGEPGLRVGYVQSAGGALPGALSRDVAELRERGLLAGHVTAGPAYGGEHEAISLVGALDAAARRLGWEAIVCGPGPGILGSATSYGHGGLAALDSAHAALALGLPTLLSPRLSGADPRPRHRGLSHHTASVLELLLASVRIPVPEIELEGWPTGGEGLDEIDLPSVLDALHEACDDRHDVAVEPVDLEAYAASGLSARTMGRTIAQDPLFFAAPLAAGAGAGRRRSGEGLSGMERIGSETIWEGVVAQRSHRRVSLPRRLDLEARGRRPPGSGGDGRRTTSACSTWFASRARRWGRTPCWSCRRASSTCRARAPSSAPSASWPRRSARRPRSGAS